MEKPIRVFVSYSHQDKAVVEKLVKILEECGIMVLWSKKLVGGSTFDEYLKIFIEHAHIFMPVITKSSSKRGWVHHEIGYAMALHISVFPIVIGDFEPEGMLQSFHAVKFKDDIELFREQISTETLGNLLDQNALPAVYQRAGVVEERAEMIKIYSDKVIFMGKHGLIRQKGGLSSFHIPNVHIGHQVWTDRYYPGDRSSLHKERQRGERIALEKHASEEGCRLIVNPMYAMEGKSKLAARTRISTFLSFLETFDQRKVIVAFQNRNKEKESLTIVGDWFLAESVSFRDGDGFTNTFFTRNASEISKRIVTFDEELDDLLDQNGWTSENSCKNAKKELEMILAKLDE